MKVLVSISEKARKSIVKKLLSLLNNATEHPCHIGKAKALCYTLLQVNEEVNLE